MMDRLYTCRHVRYLVRFYRYLVLVIISSGTFVQYILNHDFGLISYAENLNTSMDFYSDDRCSSMSNLIIPDFLWLPVVHLDSQKIKKYRNINLSRNERISLSNTYLYGIVCSQICSAYLCFKYNVKNVVGYATIAAALCNMFTFVSHRFNFWSLFILRFFISFFSTFLFPGSFLLIAKWSPPYERSYFIFGMLMSLNFGYILIKPIVCIVTMLMSKGAWCSTLSCLIFIWIILWFSIIQESPHNHTWISYSELVHITDAQEEEGFYQILSIYKIDGTWIKILKSVQVWSLILSTICYYWNFSMLLLYYSWSITRYIGMGVHVASLLVMLPNVVHIFGGFIFALMQYFFLKSRVISLTVCRKFFNLIANIIPGFLLFLEANTDCDEISLTYLFAIFFLNSAIVASILPNSIDLTPPKSSAIFAIVNTISTLGLLTVRKFVKADSLDHWREILVIGGSLYLLSGTIFLWIGSGQVLHWCRPKIHSRLQNKLLYRKTHRSILPLPKVLSDIIEETESKLKFSQSHITNNS